MKNGGRIIPAGKTIYINQLEVLTTDSQWVLYLVGRRTEVRVDHGRVHLPLLKVSDLSEFPPGLDLVVHAEGTVRKLAGWSDQR